jgi:hypothetical protein
MKARQLLHADGLGKQGAKIWNARGGFNDPGLGTLGHNEPALRHCPAVADRAGDVSGLERSLAARTD